MTKLDIIKEVSSRTGQEQGQVQITLDSFMRTIKSSMESGKNVYLRGFGSFVVTKRAKKLARNITQNTTVLIPAHYTPTFKPVKSFIERVKTSVPV